MSPPNNSINACYVEDPILQVTRPVRAEELVCRADALEALPSVPASVDSFDANVVSRSALLRDAFGSRPRVNPIWNDSPLNYTIFSLFPAACSGPADTTPPGDPLQSATPLGAELRMNSNPLAGNLDGVQLTGSGSGTAVAWSVFDATTPSATGTFAFLRSGTSGGSVATASNETSARHLTTSAAMLDDGSTVVAYTRATGTDEPSSIVARRLSATGTPGGGEITILPSQIRSSNPDVRLIGVTNGFVAVYRDGGNLIATSFDNNGAQTGTRDLGPAPAQRNHYVVSRGLDDTWVLAEVVGANQIHVRSFSRVSPGSIDHTLSTSGLSATANLSVAMNEEGTVMAAWNSEGGGISGSVLGGPDSAEPFRITSSGLANTMSLANDHRGNFFFAWEQGGQVLARVYNGTSSFTTPADFSVIATGTTNSNVQAHVSDDGVFTLSWVRSGDSGGTVTQDLFRRDYRLNYE